MSETQGVRNCVDLIFSAQEGCAVPRDHGYALYAAVSRLVPAVHLSKDLGLFPIKGTPAGNGTLLLRHVLVKGDELQDVLVERVGRGGAVKAGNGPQQPCGRFGAAGHGGRVAGWIAKSILTFRTAHHRPLKFNSLDRTIRALVRQA